MTRLSPEEVRFFDEHGYVVRTSVLARDEVHDLLGAIDRLTPTLLAAAGQGREYLLDGKRFVDVDNRTLQFEYDDHERLRVVEPVHDCAPELDALADDPRITNPMRDLVGSEALALWTTKLNYKPAHIGSGFGWHQDSPYWMHASDHLDQLPNVMVTLDDATRSNGAFQVIDRSHRNGILPGTADGSQLGGFYTDPDEVCGEAAVVMEVPAGSLVFFSPHSIHGSGPNRSGVERRALVYTYQPAGHTLLKTGQPRPVT